MDQIAFSYTSSSSSSEDHHPPKTITSSTQLSYHNSLHSVRKSIQKPTTTTKHFIAPLPPAPLKVYKIDSINFKETVHALTSDPKFQSQSGRRLKDIAPPPLVLSKPPPPPLPPSSQGGGTGTVSPLSAFTLSPDFCKFLNETLDTTRFKSKSSPAMDYFGGLSPLGLGLSPAPPRGYDPSGMAVMTPLHFPGFSMDKAHAMVMSTRKPEDDRFIYMSMRMII
ncbi:hypothetical protein LXL04_006652 [Taraxacum kok-saghyz]